jgi:hypothetical protein
MISIILNSFYVTTITEVVIILWPCWRRGGRTGRRSSLVEKVSRATCGHPGTPCRLQQCPALARRVYELGRAETLAAAEINRKIPKFVLSGNLNVSIPVMILIIPKLVPVIEV